MSIAEVSVDRGCGRAPGDDMFPLRSRTLTTAGASSKRYNQGTIRKGEHHG